MVRKMINVKRVGVDGIVSGSVIRAIKGNLSQDRTNLLSQ